MQIEVLDAQGAVVNSYSSADAAAAGGRGGRGGRGGAGGAGGADQVGSRARRRFGRGGAGVQTRVTKDAGINRVVWNVQSRDGVTMPPGSYQVRLTVNGAAQTKPFKVLIDPNVAATGVTVADLVEQYQHVLAVRAFTQQVTQLATRVRDGARRGEERPGGQAGGDREDLLAAGRRGPRACATRGPGCRRTRRTSRASARAPIRRWAATRSSASRC